MIDLSKPALKNGSLGYIPNKEYHEIDAISASGLKMMKKSFRLYYLKNKLKRNYSKALDMGTAFHEAVLEPEKFDIGNFSLGAASAASLECMINNAQVMFGYIIEKCWKEISFFYKNEDLGVDQRLRVDAYDPEEGIVYDLKSTRYSNPAKFESEAYELGYHIQAAWYLDVLRALGYRANGFAFLVVPSESPFEPFAYTVTEELYQEGRADYGDLVNGYKEFLATPEKAISYKELYLPYRERVKRGLIGHEG